MIIPIIDLRLENKEKKIAKEIQISELKRLERKFVIEFVESNYVDPNGEIKKEKEVGFGKLLLKLIFYILFLWLIIPFQILKFSWKGIMASGEKFNLEKKAKRIFKEEMRREGYDVDSLL